MCVRVCVSEYSLVVIRAPYLRWLGLRSLREISAGKVIIKQNPVLCYTRPDQWARLLHASGRALIQDNSDPNTCGEGWIWPSVMCVCPSKACVVV